MYSNYSIIHFDNGRIVEYGKLCAIEKHRLLTAEVTEHYAYQLRDRILAEPITATITIPFAFVGPIFWEIAWLAYPLIVWAVRRRRTGQGE